MESFLQCAIQMLREFRALIQHSPIAITCHRLLQLIALNMFAIDCSQLKGKYKNKTIASQTRELQEGKTTWSSARKQIENFLIARVRCVLQLEINFNQLINCLFFCAGKVRK